ncbi:response regulator transcription factor [Labilibacter sediminis]|nr:response regulator transcription factor [Labilibacter sediminis]
MQVPRKICIVDNNKSFRDALRFFIETKTDWEIIQEECSCIDLLKNGLNIQSNIIIIDINIPETDAIEATKRLLQHYHFVNITTLAMTMHCNKYFIKRLKEAGFKGCILKRDLYTELIITVDTIMSDEPNFKI